MGSGTHTLTARWITPDVFVQSQDYINWKYMQVKNGNTISSKLYENVEIVSDYANLGFTYKDANKSNKDGKIGILDYDAGPANSSGIYYGTNPNNSDGVYYQTVKNIGYGYGVIYKGVIRGDGRTSSDMFGTIYNLTNERTKEKIFYTDIGQIQSNYPNAIGSGTYRTVTDNYLKPVLMFNSSGNAGAFLAGDVIIDNLCISADKPLSEHGFSTNSTLFANGHILIMGTGIENPELVSTSTNGSYALNKGAPQIAGGKFNTDITTPVEIPKTPNGSTMTTTTSKSMVFGDGSEYTVKLATFVIVHSGIYSNIVGGSFGSNNKIGSDTEDGALSTCLILKGGTTVDTLIGGFGGTGGELYGGVSNAGERTGGTFVYMINHFMPGDNWEDIKTNTRDANGNGFYISQASILEAGNSQGSKSTFGTVFGSTHVFLTGTTSVWDVQGGGRNGFTRADQSYLEVSGDATVRHVLCGTITDGSNEIQNDCVGSVKIVIRDDAKVASIYGAGYDTSNYPYYKSMLGGKIEINMTGGKVHDIFGGGYRGSIGGEIGNTDLTISIKVEGGEVYGSVYGGGSGGLDKIRHLKDGTFVEPKYQEYLKSMGRSYVYGDIEVTIGGTAKVHGSVYGGGMSVPKLSSYEAGRDLNTFSDEMIDSKKKIPDYVATVYGNTVVTVKDTAEIFGSVYGGGKGIECSYNYSTYKWEAVDVSKFWVTDSTPTDGNPFIQIPWYTDSSGNYTATYDMGNSFLTYTGDKITGGYYVDFAKVYGDTNVLIEGGTIHNDVFGGGAQGKVEGSTMVEMEGGLVMGNVFGGGLGLEDIVSVTGSRTVYIGNERGRSKIDGAVYGSSSKGDDGTKAAFQAGKGTDSIVVIDQAVIGGSVFGGGFMGDTWGDTYVYVGYKFKTEIVENNVTKVVYRIEFNDGYDIKEISMASVYAGGNVSTNADDDDDEGIAQPFVGSLVKGNGTVKIFGNSSNGGNVSISGSIMGSGNSCKTDGTKTIEIVQLNNTVPMTGIHRADTVLIKQSLLNISGRNTITDNKIASLYEIGELTLQYDATLRIQYPADQINYLLSLNNDNNPTTPGSPSNSIVFTGGATLYVRDGTVPGEIVGNMIMATQGQSTYGAYALASTTSSGGFVVNKNGTFRATETTDFDQQTRCWFIGGTEKRSVAMEMNAAVGGTSESPSAVIVTKDISVDLMKMSSDTVLEYLGGTFTPLGSASYSFVNPDNLSDANQFGLILGVPYEDHVSGLVPNVTNLDYTYTVNNVKYPYFSETYKTPIVLDAGAGINKNAAGSYSLNIRLIGAPINQSAYLGYVTLNFQEIKEVTVEGKPSRMATNYIEVRVDMYVMPQEGTSAFGQPYNVTIKTEETDTQNHKYEGYVDVLFPKTGSMAELVLDKVVFTETDNPIVGNPKVRVTTVMNQDNTTGWMTAGSVVLSSNSDDDQSMGYLSGTSVATVRYYLEYTGETAPGPIELTFLIKIGSNDPQTSKILLNAESKQKVTVTFHNIQGRTDSPTKQFYSGSKLDNVQDLESGVGFIGWYTDEGYKSLFNRETPITTDLRLYARYMHTVTFDNMDGTSSKLYVPQTQNGAKIDELPVLERSGYSFDGWYKDRDFVYKWEPTYDTVTSDMTLYAKLTGNEYKVVFKYGNNVTFDSDSTDGYDGYVLKIAKKVEGSNVVSYPLYPTVRIGSNFEIIDANHNNMNILDYVQSKIKDQVGENQKFIRWQAFTDGDTNKDPIPIYHDTILTTDMVNTSGNEIVLYALTSSVAIKVVMDAKATDASAVVEAPSTFYVFPDSYAGTETVERLQDMFGNYYYRDRNILTPFEVTKRWTDDDNVEHIETVTYYRDIYGNEWDKNSNVANLVASTVYYMSGNTEISVLCITDNDYPASFYYKDKYGNRYNNVTAGANCKPTAPNDVYQCLEGYSNTYYSFTYTLNDATRNGYRLVDWDNDKIVDPLHPRPGSERTVKIFFTKNGTDILVTRGIIEATDSNGNNAPHLFDDYSAGNSPKLNDGSPNNDYTITYKADWKQIDYSVTVSPTVNSSVNVFLVDSNGTRTLKTVSTFTAHYGDIVEISYSSSGHYQFSRWMVNGSCSIEDQYSSSTQFMVTGDCTVAASDIGDRAVNLIMIYDGNMMPDSEVAKTKVYMKKISDNPENPIAGYTGQQYYEMIYRDRDDTGAIYSNNVPLGLYQVCVLYEGHKDYCTMVGDLKIDSSGTTTYRYYLISVYIQSELEVYESNYDLVQSKIEPDGSKKYLKSKNTDAIISYTRFVGGLESIIFSHSQEQIVNNTLSGLPAVEVEIAPGYQYKVFEGFDIGEGSAKQFVVSPVNYKSGENDSYLRTDQGVSKTEKFHLNWTEYDEPADIIIIAEKIEHTVKYHISDDGSFSEGHDVTATATLVYGDKFLDKVPSGLSAGSGKYLKGWYFGITEDAKQVLGKDVLDETTFTVKDVYAVSDVGTTKNVRINICTQDLSDLNVYTESPATVVFPVLWNEVDYSGNFNIIPQAGMTFREVVVPESLSGYITVGSVQNGRIPITVKEGAFNNQTPVIDFRYDRNTVSIQIANESNQIYSGAWEEGKKAVYGQEIPLPIMKKNANGDSIVRWTTDPASDASDPRITERAGVYYYSMLPTDSGTISFTAVYPAKTINVTFITPVGKFVESNQQRYTVGTTGGSIAAPEMTYTDTIYTLLGFYDGDTPVSFPLNVPVNSSDRTLVAHWTVKSYGFKLVDNTNASMSITTTKSADASGYRTFEHHSEIVLSINPKPGYDIDLDATYTANGITTAAAKSAIGAPIKLSDNRGYTWTFFVEDAYTGTETSNIKIDFKIVTKVSSANINFIVNGTKDDTITILYDGQAGEKSSQNIPINTVVTFRDKSDGTQPWYTSLDANEVLPYTTDGNGRLYTLTVTENISLYTTGSSHRIYYHGYDDEQIGDPTVVEGNITLINSDYTYPGYKFIGWALLDENGKKVYTYNPGATIVTDLHTPANIHLYAFCLKDGNTEEILRTAQTRSSIVENGDSNQLMPSGYTVEIRYSGSTVLDGNNYTTSGQTGAISFDDVGNHTVYYYGVVKSGNTIIHEFCGSFVVKIVPEHLVSFVNEGEEYYKVRASNGEKITAPASNPIRDGYRFDGWYIGGNAFDFTNTTISNDMILTAHWTKIHTVTFDSVGGSSVPSQAVPNGEKATAPSNPTRVYTAQNSYTFDGWYQLTGNGRALYDFNTAVTSDITLVAEWTVNQACTVSFYGKPNNGPPVLMGSMVVYSGDKVSPPSGLPGNRDGLTFLGWFIMTGTDGSVVSDTAFNFATTVITTDINLLTKWQEHKFSISFNANGGTGSIPTKQNVSPFDENIVIGSGVSRTGYRLLGWSLSATGDDYEFVDNIVPHGYDLTYNNNVTVTLYAKWIQQFTVNFYDSDGTTLLYTQTRDNGSLVQDPGTPTKGEEGQFTFEGWLKVSDGLGYNMNTPVTGDLNLKAAWSESSKFTVSFYSLRGINNELNREGFIEVYDGQTLTGEQITAVNPSSQPGLNFEGWYVFDGTDPSVINGPNAQKFNRNLPIHNDVYLVTKWTPYQYHLAFDLNAPNNHNVTGSMPDNLTSVSYGQPTAIPQGISCGGYRLLGWSLTQIGPVQFKNTVSGVLGDAADGSTVTLYAIWSDIYTVTWDTDGGTLAEESPITITVSVDQIPTIPVVTKTMNEFAGWYISETVRYDDNTYAINDDVTLKAKWTKIHTVTFDSSGGVFNSEGSPSVITSQVLDGNIVTKPTPDPEKQMTTENRYVFKGWYLITNNVWTLYDFENTTVTSDITLVADWTVEGRHAVRYYSIPGNGNPVLVGTDLVYSGDTVSPPNGLPEDRDGLTFLGWYKMTGTDTSTAEATPFDFTSPITQDVNLMTKWKAHLFSINFNANGGIGSVTPMQNVSPFRENIVFDESNVSRIGYTLVGWSLISTGDSHEFTNHTIPHGYDLTYDDNVTVTLYAKWQINTYQVTFTPDNGTDIASQTVNHGNMATVPAAPTKEGYRFLGWYLNDTQIDIANTPITSNINLVGKWIQQIIVTFDPDNGSETFTVKVDVGATVNAPASVPTKGATGQYTFGGWYKIDSLREYHFSDQVTEDFTLKAKWIDNVIHTVSFYSLKGNNELSREAFVQVYNGQTVTEQDIVNATPPDQNGLTFLGWYVFDGTDTSVINSPSAQKFNREIPITDDVYLVTKWKINTYNITFNANAPANHSVEGTVPTDFRLSALGEPTAITNSITCSGYRFIGWSQSSTATEAQFTNSISGPLQSSIVPTQSAADNETITLYAIWKQVFSVQFLTDDVLFASQEVLEGEKAIEPIEIPQKETIIGDGDQTEYRFVYWYAASESVSFNFNSEIHSNVQLHAKWATSTQHIVNYYSMYGGQPTLQVSVLVDDGGYTVESNPPAQYGLTFVGWVELDKINDDNPTPFDFEHTQIKSGLDLAPIWSIDQFVIEFNLTENLPEVIRDNVQGKVVSGESTNKIEHVNAFMNSITFDDSSVTVAGLRLLGWDLSPTGDSCEFRNHVIDRSLYTKGVSEVTLYAIWSDTCTVSFDTSGGSAISAQTIDVGSAAHTPLTPTKTGYRFIGWYLGDTEYDFSTLVYGDTTIIAKWFRLCVVEFDSASGTNVPTQYVEPGSKAIKPADPTRDGYEFVRWTLAGQSTAYDFNSAVNSDIRLTAVWSEIYIPDPEPMPAPEPQDEITRERETKENEDGSTTVIDRETINGKDGSRSENVTERTTFPDGSTETKEESSYRDSEGNTTDTKVTTTVVKDDYGNTIETTLSEKTSSDGSKVSEEYRTVSDPDGRLSEKEISIVSKDAYGNEETLRIRGDGESVEAVMPNTEIESLREVQELISDIAPESVTLTFGAEGDSVVIPSEYVREVSENQYNISLSNTDHAVVLDSDVVQRMSSDNQDVTLTIRDVGESDLSNEQKAVIGDNPAVTLMLYVGSTVVSDLGGSAYVSVKCDGAFDHVYFVANDGTVEEIQCTYDAENGTMDFTLVHFSVYVLTSGPIKTGSDMYALYIAVIAAIALSVIAVAVILGRRI
ncbi:MAG: InlB B-repeat-containing protein [Candidatus Methanomethylophilaceae archaeon]|nr:InlB B-repeat-containing protein [Candidatus Methanomethylophilaceae archaeon]